MKKPLKLFSIGLVCLSVSGASALAANNDREPGWYGNIVLGGMYTDTESNLNTDGEETIPSLDHEADSDDEGNLLAMGRLGYLTDTGYDFYIASKGDIRLGAAYQYGDFANIGLEAFYRPDEVWQDPYLTGAARQDTDEDETGAKLYLEDIMGTGLMFSYALADVDVDEDVSGNADDLLQRDGNKHEIEIGFAYKLTDRQTLTPLFTYTVADLDGDAEAYDYWKVGLMYEHKFTKVDFVVEVSGGKRDYDDDHPLFGLTRDEDVYKVGTAITYNEPFGYEGYYVLLLASYEDADSNITFFDEQETMFGLGVGYKF